MIASALLAFACLVLAVVAVYPYVVYPAVLGALPHRKAEGPMPVDGVPDVTFSLIFCCYNERGTIEEKLENLDKLVQRYPDLEILVYDDASSDGTADLIVASGTTVTLVRGERRAGKATGMRLLAGLARGDVIVCTDANVLLREDLFENLGPHFRDQRVGGVCGTLQYVNPVGSAVQEVGGAYWSREEKVKSLESRTGSVMGADGSIFAVRRALYPEIPGSVQDDFWVSMHVVYAGFRLIHVDDVVVYERLVSRSDDERARRVRIATRAYHTHRMMRRHRRELGLVDTFKYYSHKVLRWHGGGVLVASAFCGVVAISLAFSPLVGVCVMAAAVVSIAIATRHPRGGFIMEALSMILATTIGVIRATRGDLVVTWDPAKSR
ncbi:glycosyltransferase [Cellulomonas humilata]|uniref:Cellulose synthase/poly-beta-1,6-N-acetylglucosamine synthase-like glycosyltransferase n=1 Tax=Cellulomonas humilata TaxID=144055 RepID=A0ABU0EA28_9CELL|nr:glycosyltransferase [Cellulomonas humilata]MDQ0372110.1 cellulose synthase/poly-beta-1,6-N-acetylglucosamine synthase-like glycosyltransferase [Cellulomonas humilata]